VTELCQLCVPIGVVSRQVEPRAGNIQTCRESCYSVSIRTVKLSYPMARGDIIPSCIHMYSDRCVWNSRLNTLPFSILSLRLGVSSLFLLNEDTFLLHIILFMRKLLESDLICISINSHIFLLSHKNIDV
jgi:hypothetical protein